MVKFFTLRLKIKCERKFLSHKVGTFQRVSIKYYEKMYSYNYLTSRVQVYVGIYSSASRNKFRFEQNRSIFLSRRANISHLWRLFTASQV